MTDTIFNKAVREHRQRREQKGNTVEVDGESIELDDPQTSQAVEDTVLTSSKHGVPRGREAYEAHQLAQTQPMEVAKNVIVDQLSGGDIVSRSEEDGNLPTGVETFQDVIRDILNGPHLMGDDFDDLISAAISDMIGPGNAYWETIASADGRLPVASLKPVPALSIQHNLTAKGKFDNPPYYQHPFRSATGDTISVGRASFEELDQEDLIVMHWPGSRRSDKIYPMSPAMQVKQWLQLLLNIGTHTNRFFSDNEIPPGILHIPGVNKNTIEGIKQQLKDARGDPRKVPVINPDSDAKWIEVGGTGLNLDVLEGEKWFTQMVWGALGLNKTEIGIVEDVNRSAGVEQSTIIFKRITKPLTDTIMGALTTQMLPQFDVYNNLGKPFVVDLKHSDPVREREQEEHVREQWNDDLLTFNETRRELGREPPEDTLIEINGEEVDYGELPKSLAKRVLQAASAGDTIEIDTDSIE